MNCYDIFIFLHFQVLLRRKIEIERKKNEPQNELKMKKTKEEEIV